MPIIDDGRKVQVWEFVFQGLNIGKWSTGKHCDGVAVVKNVKTDMCQKGATLPLTYTIGPKLQIMNTYTIGPKSAHLNGETKSTWLLSSLARQHELDMIYEQINEWMNDRRQSHWKTKSGVRSGQVFCWLLRLAVCHEWLRPRLFL